MLDPGVIRHFAKADSLALPLSLLDAARNPDPTEQDDPIAV